MTEGQMACRRGKVAGATPDERKRLIQVIHVAKRQLALAEEEYREILYRAAGKESAALMTNAELRRVVEYVKRCGFKVRSKGRGQPASASLSRTLAQDAESRKIRALWLFLHRLGVVTNPSEAALAAYVKRLTGVDALQWTDGAQADRLIESLKKWGMRFLPRAVEDLAAQARGLRLADDERHRLDAVVFKALDRRTFDPMREAWEHLDAILPKENAHG